MLEIKNISKDFNSKQVLKNISFTVPKGKIFGIIGPNGAGKTTTLRILLGILKPTSGEVYFNGEIINQSFMNITGYLPEERGLYPKSNIVNILVYFGKLKGLSHSHAINNTKYWLERLDLLDYQKFTVEELSKGNQQKIQFVAAILHKPKILILDEPFSGFDPVNQSIFTEIIEEIKNDCFIILSTHLMDLAENLCDEIFLINNGEKIISGEMKDLLHNNEQTSYKIKLVKNISDNEMAIIKNYDIIDISTNNFTINVDGNISNKIVREICNNFEVDEIIRKKNTLNELFLAAVEK